MTTTTTLTLVLLALAAYVFYKCYIYPFYLSPLRKLPGPPAGWLPIFGNMLDIFRRDVGETHSKWIAQYGPVYRVHGFFNQPRLFVADPALLQHIIGKHPYVYVKPDGVRHSFETITGRGLLVAEGAEHKRQKRYLQEIFSYRNVKAMAPTMYDVSRELVDVWKQQVKAGAASVVIDEYVTRATLDIIGQVGFGYKFNALKGGEDADTLYEAYNLALNQKQTPLNVVAFLVPRVRRYIPFFRRMETAMKTIENVVVKVIRSRWQEMQESPKADRTDLLSVLLRQFIDEGNSTISEDELKSQVLTMQVAGHETTTTAFLWTIHALSHEPAMQGKLRAELAEAFPGGIRAAPTADELNKLPYLDSVVKEVLRLHTPAPMSLRKLAEDDTLPNGLFVPKGTPVTIIKMVMHTLESVWGSDALEFRPERWLEMDTASIPHFQYVYFPFLTGTRGCIGSKIALLELKMMIACAFSALEFAPVEGHCVTKKFGIVNKPVPFVHVHIRNLE